MPKQYFNLASSVISDGVPFHRDGVYGFQKGCMAVRMENGRIKLICDNLLPIELDSLAGVNESMGKEFKSIRSAFSELETAWFGKVI